MRNVRTFDPRSSNQYPTDRQFVLHHGGDKTEVQVHDGNLHVLTYKDDDKQRRPVLTHQLTTVSEAIELGHHWSHCTE